MGNYSLYSMLNLQNTKISFQINKERSIFKIRIDIQKLRTAKKAPQCFRAKSTFIQQLTLRYAPAVWDAVENIFLKIPSPPKKLLLRSLKRLQNVVTMGFPIPQTFKHMKNFRQNPNSKNAMLSLLKN